MQSYNSYMVKSGTKSRQTNLIYSLGSTELVYYSLITRLMNVIYI